jgi:hypothetical protein
MNEEQRQQSQSNRSSMERHTLMYQIADNNPDKGKAGGDCNITQCQTAGASSYNKPMRAYYCKSCAMEINRGALEPLVDVQPDHSIERIQESDETNAASSCTSPNKDPLPTSKKIGRNDKCPCNSGLKHKKCCLN